MYQFHKLKKLANDNENKYCLYFIYISKDISPIDAPSNTPLGAPLKMKTFWICWGNKYINIKILANNDDREHSGYYKRLIFKNPRLCALCCTVRDSIRK